MQPLLDAPPGRAVLQPWLMGPASADGLAAECGGWEKPVPS